jgi:hypothetical protein
MARLLAGLRSRRDSRNNSRGPPVGRGQSAPETAPQFEEKKMANQGMNQNKNTRGRQHQQEGGKKGRQMSGGQGGQSGKTQNGQNMQTRDGKR